MTVIGVFVTSAAGLLALVSGQPTAWSHRLLVLVGNICFISFSALVIVAGTKLAAVLAPWFPQKDPQDPPKWEPSRTTLARYSLRIRLFFTAGLSIPLWLVYHQARVQTKIGLLFASVVWTVFGLYLVLKVWFTKIHLEPDGIRIRNCLGLTRWMNYAAIDRVETFDNRLLIRFSDGSNVKLYRATINLDGALRHLKKHHRHLQVTSGASSGHDV
jgi:hypothetical protein